MYSNIKSVQILIALLKDYNIKDVVLSPGGSDIPIIHSVENDDFFNCYSVVDERSAAYFAMGLAQAKNSPVACVCTSGSAVCNYVPGITESFYQNVPVVAITADKNPYFQGQLEIQKINQEAVFNGVVKKSVNLPLIYVEDDVWLCERLINEALLELDHHGKGPVHINIPIVEDTSTYDCNELPKVRKISFVKNLFEDFVWRKYANELSKLQRILVVVGQNIVFNDTDITNMNAFFEKYNCVYAIEHLSNLDCNGVINTYPVSEIAGDIALNKVCPDLVLSIGNNLAAYQLKPFLRRNFKKFDNWLIHEDGKVRDAYKCLTNIFECSPSRFFNMMVKYAPENALNNKLYYADWCKQTDLISIDNLQYHNFYVGQQLSKVIPDNSMLHLAILNSTRMLQFFKLNKNIKVFSNVGTLGIDGCFSSFAGQAAATDNLAFLLIGDLSFFYDMNAAGLRSIGNNVRIVLLNNGGGSEFHFFMGKERISTIDKYICAQHGNTAEGWIKSLGYEYYSAKNKVEIDRVIDKFSKPSDKPMFLEVFTEMEDDAHKTNALYYGNFKNFAGKDKPVVKVKKVVKAILSKKQVYKIKK